MSSRNLRSQKSAFNSSVTLFTLPDTVQAPPSKLEEPTTPRASKRMKAEDSPTISPEQRHFSDMEDLVTSSVTHRRSSRRTAKVESHIEDDLSSLSSAPPSPVLPTSSRKGKGKVGMKAEASSSVVARLSSSSPSKRQSKPIPQTLDNPHPAPARWKEVYDAIHKMRTNIVAPVDTMGCAQAQEREVDPKNRRLATLVSLMLSSQTKDEVTDAAVISLRQALGGQITLKALLDASPSTISACIGKVGFWRRKTEYIKQTAVKLKDDFDGDVPKTVDELCSLPGVGPKMAFLCLQVAWNLNVGIGVDVHVHRITNRLGWHRKPTKNPEETRLNLQSWLPKEYHTEINPMLVGFGQVICSPVNPKCDQCTLSENGLCPSARRNLTDVKKKGNNNKRKLISMDADEEKVVIKSEADDYVHLQQESSTAGGEKHRRTGRGLVKIEVEVKEEGVESPGL